MFLILDVLNLVQYLFKIKMPIYRDRDSFGPYYQWGNHGKKYYYISGNVRSRTIAYNKSLKQAQAAYASGYRRYDKY